MDSIAYPDRKHALQIGKAATGVSQKKASGGLFQ